MSDLRLRQLLRAAIQGEIPFSDYIAVASRVMSQEEVLLEIKSAWIPYYAAQSKQHKARVALAGVLGDEIAKQVVPSRRKDDFPDVAFFRRNQKLLSDSEWRLFAADCAERVLRDFESIYPNDPRPRQAIETARKFVIGNVTLAELNTAVSAAWSAARYASRSAAVSAAWSAARSAARSAAESAAESAALSAALSAADSAAWSAAESAAWSAAYSAESAESAERNWQRNRLIAYLLGLSLQSEP